MTYSPNPNFQYAEGKGNSLSEVGNNEEKVFMAGASTSNITPALGGGIIGEWETPEAVYIHDELHTRCHILDDGDTKLVFIVADVLGVNQDLTEAAKKLIFEKTNIPTENILISAIHTHSATSAMGLGDKRIKWSAGEPFDDYQKFLIRRFADAVRIALKNPEPVQISWAQIKRRKEPPKRLLPI